MKKQLILSPFLCILIFSFLRPAYGQELFSTRYNITHITMDNGLSHNFIDDIYKDSQGFLWIATGGGGLSRYDGYEFIHYNTNTSPVKLKSNFPRNICEDNFGRLWITSEGGVDILNLKTLQQESLKDVDNKIYPFFKQSAIHAIKDSQGNIWLCSGTNIQKITFDKQGEIARVYTLTSIPITIQAITLSDVDNDGNIWAGIGNRIYKLYTASNASIEAVPVSPLFEAEGGILINTFCLKENEVWIGTNKGLFRYNRNKEIVKIYEYQKENPRSISQNYITDLAVTQDKQLFVSTLKGINIYNPITDDFEQITQEAKSQHSQLSSNFINCIRVDNEIIWIGSETGGINKITPRKLVVRNYMHNKDNPSSLSQNLVNAIYEDPTGNLWVGTVEGGLNRKTGKNDQFSHYTTDSPAYLCHNSVSAITSDENNRLWVGTWGHGITLLDLNDSSFKKIKDISSDTSPVNFVGSLCYDSINKGMWIGTNPGIYFYDILTDQLHQPFDAEVVSKIHGSLGAIIDSKGYLWMGSMEGVFIIDLHSRNENQFLYRHLRYKLNNPESGLIEKISCFYLSADSSLWIGSNGYGIYKYELDENEKGYFTAYTTEHGLINNNVRGLLEDEQGRLWISTNNGLSCFEPTVKRFTNYTREDGLAGNQFYWNAYCRSHSGTLYFGGINGLMAIETNRRETTSSPCKVTFTHLNVANEEIFPGNEYIETNIATAQKLQLHESDKSFSLEFSALNFEPQPAAIYSYRLEGFDEDWIDVSANRRFASYTNLPAGKYTFQVKYSSEGNTTDSPVTKLLVVVKPFFYKTWWFVCLVILLASCSVIYVYLHRLYKLQKQKELLHRMVEERTKELKEQNEKITKQKTQLIHMSKKAQELTLDKLAFFTNITHEFRTPITLIIGPIERALKLSYNPQVIEQLNFVERNSKYLLSLVNQLMDFRKVESGKLEINKTKGDFLKYLESILIPFEAFAGERNIQIRRFYRMSNPEILFDPDAMQKVITNLLSNAIKFTSDGGKVSIYVISYRENDKEKLYISVKDTGTGIPEEDLPKIFFRFYQSRTNIKFPVYGQSGTGIGLYLSKRIVKLHGGTIHARNNKKEGSAFCITLPLERESGASTMITASPALLQPLEKSPSQIPSHFTPGRLTILVVEDNKDMRSYIRSILAEQYNTFEAENGAEALTLLNNNNVDFIISDLMMPVMDGIELSRKVKENFTISHIPFLMLTAKTSQESRIESYRMGVDEYLLKPFSEELLLTRITNILENRKRYQQRFAMNMEIRELQMEEESSDKKFLDKALRIIKENYRNSDYEASDFIEAMGVSKSLLNKKMQNLTGQSIGQFIRNYRLNIARELIEKNKITHNMNISEIAYEVGFNDPKYFTRCFTKRYNVPPSSLLEG